MRPVSGGPPGAGRRSTCLPAVWVAFLLVAFHAAGQGTLNFSTKVTTGVDAPVHFGVPGGSIQRVGSEYLGQLYVGLPGEALSAVGVPLPFRDDQLIGYITQGGAVTVPGIPMGVVVGVELRAWHAGAGVSYEAAMASGTGLWGAKSPPIQLTLGGSSALPAPPANLYGLQGFTIPVPEPSPVLLGAVGTGLLGATRRRRFRKGTPNARQ